jgi:FkbM family methyltransferase
VTNGAIDIIPWTGQHTYGFGCLMIMHRSSWQDIPAGLDIYYGDNYIFDLQLQRKKTNYLIANMLFHSQFAATTSDTSITGGVLEKETPIYQQVKTNMSLENNLQEKLKPAMVSAPKKKILIAIPTARNIEPETFRSIYNLEVPDGYETMFQYFYGYNIDQVRNLIADWVVKGYDYLFSVDSDIAFPPDTLTRLLAHDRDMVSGLYIQRKPGQHILEVYEHNGHGGVGNIPYEKLVGRGLVEIAGCGFGCVLIKAEVMRAIPYPHFKYHSAIDHRNTISEDVDFCRKTLASGFKIWADTDIHCRHIGQSEFVIDTSIKPSSVETRLRELGNQRLLPRDHVNYLSALAAGGFRPAVIYDVGSCVLHWTNEAKRIWPYAKFYLFEAMSSCEFLYQEGGYEYQMGVLSSQDGLEIDFWQNEEHPGGNSYYRENTEVNPQADQYFNEHHRRRLISRSLDSVVKQRGFQAPDLLKMDVQGAELDILKGATELIKSVNDVILELQVVEYNKGAPLRDAVVAYMDQLGFDCLGLFCNNGPDGDYHFRRRT